MTKPMPPSDDRICRWCSEPLGRGRRTTCGASECLTLSRNNGRRPPPKPPKTPSPEVPLDPEEAVRADLEAQRSKDTVADLRKRYRAALRQESFETRVMAAIESGVAALPPVPVPTKTKTKHEGRGKGENVTVESAVLNLADLHIGEVVDPVSMGGLGSYNFDIFVRRFETVIQKAITFAKDNLSAHEFDELVVFGLGDFVSGIIHEELEASNDLNIVEQVFQGALVIAQGIRELAGAFPTVRFVGVVGNHGRTRRGKPYFKGRYVNWDYVLYQTAALLLRDQANLTFEIPKSFFALTKVKNHQFLLLHGDNVKAWMGIPWYGIDRISSKFTELLDAYSERFEYMVMGHWHQLGIVDRVRGEKIICPCLKGGDEFVLGALFVSSDPKQLMFGVNEKWGVTWRLVLHADDNDNAPTTRYRYDASADFHALAGELF